MLSVIRKWRMERLAKRTQARMNRYNQIALLKILATSVAKKGDY